MKTFGTHRRAGILMPVASLPGSYGIGDMGADAYHFVDLVSESGLTYWQILPLNPVGYGNSPYQAYSSFAGDAIYIDLDDLYHQGLLEHLPEKAPSDYVHYDAVRIVKNAYLKEAFHNFVPDEGYHAFVQKAFWLNAYCRFVAIRKYHKGMWQTWPDDQYLEEDYQYEMFVQYIFYTQWQKLKAYANAHGVLIIGDIPIYVGLDSADVFEHPSYFLLDEGGYPTAVAGVPPDYFNDEGQLWGNPLYHWERLKANHYDFWIDRISWNSRLYDSVRIDHFRAFDTYWSVPIDGTAKQGHWELGPAYDLFDEIERRCPDANVIAEDLGDLRPEVLELRDQYHLLGMRIVQYSFGKKERKDKYWLPEYCIAYTGTHDNSPLVGWYHALPFYEKWRIRFIMMMKGQKGRSVPEKVRAFALAQPCVMAIIPMQDFLLLGEETRLNNPGTNGEPNWCWKLTDLAPFEAQVRHIRSLLEKTGRLKG